MNLSSLGPFRIERSPEYDQSPFEKSYCELIRVRGSKSEPGYSMPSHLYQYSDSELALYLKDKKNRWISLSKIVGREIDIHDDEIVIVFQLSKFPEISKLIPLVRKRGKVDLTEDEKRERGDRLNYARKMKQNDSNFDDSGRRHILTPAGVGDDHEV